MAEYDHVAAHKHSSRHRDEIAASTLCGCFHCFETFAPSAIEVWIDEGTCALCPNCTIDSVIGDASGLPVANPSFLEVMHEHWFGAPGTAMEDFDKMAGLLGGESNG